MDFRLKVFYSVATNLSFTKASHELFISQPAISKHIHELEQQYKTPLFERKGNKIQLTHAGKLLYSYSQSLLATYRQLDFEMNLLTGHFSGELRLGASTTLSQYVLPPLLAQFIKTFPDIRLSLISGNSLEIEKMIREGKIDLGLVEGCTYSNTLHYETFMRDELVIITHTKSALAVQDELTLEQFCSLPLVLRENGSGTLQVLEAALADPKIKLSNLNILIQLGNTESIKLFLENFHTLGVVSIRSVAKDIVNGTFKILEVKGLKMERLFRFVRPLGRSSGLDENFIRFLRQKKAE